MTSEINAYQGLMFLGTEQYVGMVKQLVAWSLVMSKPNMADGPASMLFEKSSLKKDLEELSSNLGQPDLDVIKEGLKKDTGLENVSSAGDEYQLTHRNWVWSVLQSELVVGKKPLDETPFTAVDGDEAGFSEEFSELSKGM